MRTSTTLRFAMLFLCALGAGKAIAQADGVAAGWATQLLDRLDAGQFQAVWESATPDVRAAIDPAALAAVWTSLPQQMGAAQGRGPVAIQALGPYQIVVVPLYFANGALNAVLSFDGEGQLAGLQFQAAAAPPPPASDLPPRVTERPVLVGDGERALPGTLSLPAGNGPFPAVVLVHGSGPQDRDETIGPNRPFRDIALGLAAHGIAVLRYDKRTFARPQDFATGDFSIDDETTTDAVAAVAVLRAQPEIDTQRVFVLGHSLGAMLAPRIAARAPGVAGAILLAAPSRPLLDLVVEQYRRNALQDGTIGVDEQRLLDDLASQIARLRAGDTFPGGDTPLGQPAAYWRSVERVDPVADVRALNLPVLILHGGRDIQVFDADWQGWQQAFSAVPRVTLRLYPALSHLGIAGEGPGSLADYDRPGAVDATLIGDIAAFVLAD